MSRRSHLCLRLAAIALLAAAAAWPSGTRERAGSGTVTLVTAARTGELASAGSREAPATN